MAFLKLSAAVAFLIFVFAGLVDAEQYETVVSQTTSTHSSSAQTKRETDAIKVKLEDAEKRVRELISKLDSFSMDASNAKAEIHSSLLETWQNVELLAKDRCGVEVESIRISQRKAEAQVAELQDAARLTSQQLEDLNIRLSKASKTEATLRTELSHERSRREAVESEVLELRDKLHWATASANETKSYDIVAEHLEALLVVVSERASLLRQVVALTTDHHAGFDDWRSELDGLARMVREVDRAHRVSGGGGRDASSGAYERRITELERRLQDVMRARDTAAAERNDLAVRLEQARAQRAVSGVALPKYASSTVAERVIFRQADREGMSVVGVVTACVMTLLCGAMLVMFCGWGGRADTVAAVAMSGDGGGGMGSPAGIGTFESKGTVTPDHRGASSGTRDLHATSSPVTHVGSGPRGSTPRRY